MYSQEVAWLLKEKYRGEKSEAFFADVARLEAGEPLAYLIGTMPFLGATIHLDSHPLIPRPETEFWVEQAIKVMKSTKNGESFSVLDLCAGSGAIGVAVATHLPKSDVTFIEIDSHHQPTIAKNCRLNGIAPERVHILLGNLFDTAQPLPQYDFILTNPPYIDAALGRVAASVATHEPALALYGGHAGLEIIAKIIAAAPTHLLPHGQLWIEHEPEQTEAITEFAAPHFHTTTHTDQYGVERFSQLVLQ